MNRAAARAIGAFASRHAYFFRGDDCELSGRIWPGQSRRIDARLFYRAVPR